MLNIVVEAAYFLYVVAFEKVNIVVILGKFTNSDEFDLRQVVDLFVDFAMLFVHIIFFAVEKKVPKRRLSRPKKVSEIFLSKNFAIWFRIVIFCYSTLTDWEIQIY